MGNGKYGEKETKHQKSKDRELGECDDTPEGHRGEAVVAAVIASVAIVPVAVIRNPHQKAVAAVVGRGR